MSGTKAGGQKTVITNRLRYGDDYYQRIGREGGKKGRTGGFFGDPERASRCGKMGGRPRGWNKTECVRGHSLADAYVDVRGGRHCRECSYAARQRYYQKRLAQQQLA